MAEEEELSSVPSGRRKPRMVSREEPEEAAEEVEEPPRKAPSLPKMPELRAPSLSVPRVSLGGGGAGGKLLYAIALIALVALYFAYTASSEVGKLKGEMRGMAGDLKEFRAKEVTIRAPLQGMVTLKKEIPLSGVFPPTLRASGTLILPVKTTLVGRSATGAIFEAAVDQNISIEFTAPLDFSKTGQGQSLLIDEEIPLGNEADIKVTARDIWGEELDSIISRLERAGQ